MLQYTIVILPLPQYLWLWLLVATSIVREIIILWPKHAVNLKKTARVSHNS